MQPAKSRSHLRLVRGNRLRMPMIKKEHDCIAFTFAPSTSEPGTPPDELVAAIAQGWRRGIFSDDEDEFPITEEEIGGEPLKALLRLVEENYVAGFFDSRRMALSGIYRYVPFEEIGTR